MTLKKASILIIIILLIDQISKIYIKTHFTLGEEIYVLEQFRIHFVENEGMAWGAKIPGEYGKLILTLFRIVAIFGIGYWLWDSVQKKCTSYPHRLYRTHLCRCLRKYNRLGVLRTYFRR